MWIPLIVLIFVVIYVWSLYNKLVTFKIRIGASVQEIGNQLKRQADLIPNLQNTAKAYLENERAIYDKLTEARTKLGSAITSGKAKDMVEASDFVQQAIRPALAILESNPAFRAVEMGQTLMENLRDSADKIMYSRRLLIDLSADYNTAIVVFPSNIVANLFGFKAEAGLATPRDGEHVTVSANELQTPKVNL
ncbi:MAG: LemA family protein [bacterium]|nr:LemA family protein [bacterium]